MRFDRFVQPSDHVDRSPTSYPLLALTLSVIESTAHASSHSMSSTPDRQRGEGPLPHNNSGTYRWDSLRQSQGIPALAADVSYRDSIPSTFDTAIRLLSCRVWQVNLVCTGTDHGRSSTLNPKTGERCSQPADQP